MVSKGARFGHFQSGPNKGRRYFQLDGKKQILGSDGAQTKPSPSLKEQAAAHRASKAPEAFRARALLARTDKQLKSVARSAKRRLKTGRADAGTASRVDRATVLAKRAERLARIAIKPSSTPYNIPKRLK